MASTLDSIAESVAFPPFRLRRFSVDEYQRLAEVGILTEEDRVELLEGWIVPEMNRKPVRDLVIEAVAAAIGDYLPSGWRIRIQSAITTTDSQPEPDVAVVAGGIWDNQNEHPSSADVTLVVEVSDTSLTRDRQKLRIDARANLATYWIVNLVDRCIEVYTNPSGPTAEPSYGSCATFREGEALDLTIGEAAAIRIQVDSILPPLRTTD